MEPEGTLMTATGWYRLSAVIGVVLVVVILAGCGTVPGPYEDGRLNVAHRDCAGFGHRPGTAGYAGCMERTVARRQAEAAMFLGLGATYLEQAQPRPLHQGTTCQQLASGLVRCW